nr:MAG TPA: hypothetical protein [Caudoviricetes sp.]
MAMANLDIQDLNTLLNAYANEHHELEKNIGDLQLINLRIHQTAAQVTDPDVITCGAYMRSKTAEVDLNKAKEKLKVLENKLQYIHELIDNEIATSARGDF